MPEMTDTGFLFEPGAHGPWPDRDGSIPTSLFVSGVPSPPLGEFVERFWFYRCPAPLRVRERVLPTGTMGLAVDLRDDAPGPLVLGARSEAYAVDGDGEAWSVGVSFRPGGAAPFLDVPAGALHNAHASLEALWGRGAETLRARLLEANTPAAMFRVLERTLLARAVRPLARRPAVAFALREFQRGSHAPTVGDVTGRLGLSPRAFIRIFTEDVGLSPKRFCRVRRFQEVLRRARAGRRVDWARVALDCGYCDQAHCIRDFRAFSGLTPSAFLKLWGEHLEYGARWTSTNSSKTPGRAAGSH